MATVSNPADQNQLTWDSLTREQIPGLPHPVAPLNSLRPVEGTCWGDCRTSFTAQLSICRVEEGCTTLLPKEQRHLTTDFIFEIEISKKRLLLLVRSTAKALVLGKVGVMGIQNQIMVKV